nr:pelargonidin 3-O-(6-caffeoylglucoside) 5-O-(6-O-malonylglucoside) 4'''-malonyltransferase-like [Tanacetum cinerariifolium]
MMDDQEGDGIEAWVHFDEKRTVTFGLMLRDPRNLIRKLRVSGIIAAANIDRGSNSMSVSVAVADLICRGSGSDHYRVIQIDSFETYLCSDCLIRWKSQNDVHANIFNHLETSLSDSLTDFYPLAGSYVRDGSFIDCSDQGNAISKMREKIIFEDNHGHRPSKVQLVLALLWKTFVGIDKVNNNGQSKASFLSRGVNLRNKAVPKLPDNLCGNFVSVAVAQIEPSEGDDIDLQGFFVVLRDSVKKYDIDYSKALMPGADFGWGKPVWKSIGKFAAQNYVILMDDQEGDGVEAWVHLDEKRMHQLEQDHDIKAYAV